MAKRLTRKIITILSLAIVLVMALQVLLHGNVGLATAEKKTVVDLTVTNKDVTVRVPYADISVFASAAAR